MIIGRIDPSLARAAISLRSSLVPALALLLVSAMLVVSIPAAPAAPDWVGPVNISPGDTFVTDNFAPQIALDSSGYSHVVWTGSSGRNQVYYATNEGGSWSEPLRISTSSNDNGSPQLTVGAGDQVHVVWDGHDPGREEKDVYYAVRTGGNWSVPEAISPDSTNDHLPQLALEADNTVHVVWAGSDGTADRAWYTTGTAGSWSDPDMLSPGLTGNDAPQVALDPGGHAHVVWYGYDGVTENTAFPHVFYSTGTAGSWSAPERLSTNTISGSEPRIAVDSLSRAHVVFTGHAPFGEGAWMPKTHYTTGVAGSWSAPENMTLDIFYSEGAQVVVDSSDNAHRVWSGVQAWYNVNYNARIDGEWTMPDLLSTNADYFYENQFAPQIALGPDDTPHVAWYGCDETDEYGNPFSEDVYYTTKDTTGWLDPALLSTTSAWNYHPQLAVDSANLASVVWYGQEEGANHIFYATGSAEGCSAPQRISSDIPATGSKDDRGPQLAMGPDNRPQAVWTGFDGSDQVYYNSGLGTEWAEPVRLSTSGAGHSPRIAVDPNGHAHVVWCGYDGTEDEIFYSTNAEGSWSGPVAISTMSGGNTSPEIAVDSRNRVHVIWAGDDETLEDRVFHSTKDGSGWTGPVVVSGTVAGNRNPQMALDAAGNPQAVWCAAGASSLEADIYYNADPGSGWGTPALLTEASYLAQYDPQIALDPEGRPHVAWHGYQMVTTLEELLEIMNDPSLLRFDIYYTTDTGDGWEEPVRMDTEPYYQYDPRIVVDPSGCPHIVWYGYGGPDTRCQVYYATGYGGGWTAPRQLSTQASYDQRYPQIAMDSTSHPYVVWEGQGESGRSYVYYRDNQGAGWTAPLALSTNSYWNYSPRIAVDSDGQPHVAWDGWDNVETDRIWYTADLIPYSVTAEVTAGSGTVDPAGQVVLNGHDAAPISIIPGTGWHIQGVTDNGAVVTVTDPAGMDYGIPGVTGDHAVKAAFAINTYDIAAAAGAGGTTIPSGTVSVDHGSDQTFAIIPDAGYHVAGVMVDGVSVGAVTSYTFEGVTAGHTISAVFASDSRTITASAGPNGSIDPAGSVVVGYGSDQTFGFSPDTGYHLSDVLVDGISVGAVASYAFTNVTADHSILAVFAHDPYTFYFAEGCTGEGFQEYICLGNPGAAAADVLATFMFPDGTILDQSLSVPASSRMTVDVNAVVGAGKEVSARIASDQPIVAERPMYFDYRGEITGGHDAVGAVAPANAWYFAEGFTGEGFEQYVCVLNPGDAAAGLTFRYQTQEAGEIVKEGYSVPAHSRSTFKVNDMLGPGYQASLKLESSRPVVAERPMYFDYLGPSGDLHWTGGHCVTGTPTLHGEYYFAEGNTRPGFHEYLTLQNPGDAEITVDAVYQLGAGQGSNVEKSYTVGARGRATVLVWNEVEAGRDVSVRLSSESDFLAERPMYFDYWDVWTGGHCVIGAPAPAAEWLFAEGYTGEGFHEWLCLQNPGTVDAVVEITYLKQKEGIDVVYLGQALAEPPARTIKVPAGSRETVFVNADVGEGCQLSVRLRVISGDGILAERPMYFDFRGWTGGHAVVGYTP